MKVNNILTIKPVVAALKSNIRHVALSFTAMVTRHKRKQKTFDISDTFGAIKKNRAKQISLCVRL